MVAAASPHDRKRRARRWGVGAASLAAHLLVVWALAVDLQRVVVWPVPPQAQNGFPAFNVQLVGPRALTPHAAPAPKSIAAPAPAATDHRAGANSATERLVEQKPAVHPDKPPPAPEATAGATQPGTAPPGEASAADEAANAQVTAALRGALACNSNHLIKLSPEQRAKCDEQMAGLASTRASGRVAAGPLGMSPEAKEASDLAVRENKSAHLPFPICFFTFEPGKIHWYHASRGVKMGPLPCYVVAPKGLLLPDKEKAKGFMDQPSR